MQIEESDLVRCSGAFKEKDIERLASALDDGTLNLLQISKKSNEMTHVKAFLILKKWLQAHPSTSKDLLIQKLEAIGFHKASQR